MLTSQVGEYPQRRRPFLPHQILAFLDYSSFLHKPPAYAWPRTASVVALKLESLWAWAPNPQWYTEFIKLRRVTWTKVVRRGTFGNKYAGTARQPARLQQPVAIKIMEPPDAIWDTRRSNLGKVVISDLAAPCWRCPGAA